MRILAITIGILACLVVPAWAAEHLAGIQKPATADHVQGTITAVPDEKGTFIVQPQGTTAPCVKMKVTTDPNTVITITQEKIKVTDLKVGMWVRAELSEGVATKIVAGHLWLEEGERLVLFKGLPQEFFTYPAGFDVNNVATKFGPLRMVYRLVGNGSYLRWGRKALPKEGMVVCWPTTLKARFSYGPPVKPDDQGMIHLPADVSELRIWFADSIVPKKDGVQKRGVDVEMLADPAKARTELQRREVYFSGHVQGVGFRQTTATLAEKFAVTGFVKNLPDGRVQLVVEGQPKEIEAFLGAIRKERAENISKTEEKTGRATKEFQGFGIRY